MSTVPATSLTDAEYQRETSALLARIEAAADGWLQDDVIDVDTHRTGGLLELAFPNGSKIIVNTQPPLHEVWLAAKAGGFHYRHVDGQWRDTRDGSEFIEALARPEGQLHFAGEHTSLWTGWMQGALESARRVVKEVNAPAATAGTWKRPGPG